MADTILSNRWVVYYKSENRQQRIVRDTSVTPSTIDSVNTLYSALQDLFDNSAQMDDGVPMSAQTPTEYTIGIIDASDKDPWFIDNNSTKYLSGGAIQTSSWTRSAGTNTGIVRMGYTAGVALVASDIGKDILMTLDGDRGTLLDYDSTHLWIRPDSNAAANSFDNSPTSNGAWTIVSGTGTGNQSGGAASTGESLWSNIFTLGSLVSGTTLDVYQNDTQITPWWSSGQIDILVRVKQVGTEIDSGNLAVLARKYTTLYDHFVIDASSGRNPVPLAAFTDGNNQTAEGTVSGYSDITFTFGAASRNLNNGNGARPYDVEINGAGRSLTQIYEYLKYVTRSSSALTLNGVPGEYYVAVGDIRLDYSGESSGPFVQGSAISSSSGGSGYIVSLIDNGTTGTLVIRNVHGTFLNTNTITSGATTATINGVPDTITPSKQAPFGTFAGGSFFGARGVYLTNMDAADSNKYQLIDSTNTTQSPPSTVAVKVEGLVSGDSVAVFRSTGSGSTTVDKTYLTSHATNNSAATTAWEVDASTPIPADTPASGFIRLVKTATGTEERIQFNSWTGNIFTLNSAHAGGYGASDKAYVPFIDAAATGASVSVSIQYTANRFVVARVRKLGIQPFTTTGTLTNTGYSTTAIRTTDSIA